MIEFIAGKLIEKTPTCAVIQTGGIGLQVLIPLSSYDALPAVGSDVHLHSLLVVREDSLTLYGFMKLSERRMFEQLTQVSGIGPKLGLTALSGLSIGALQNAIMEGDVKRLSSISGIGKKMAERMVVELRDKIEKGSIEPSSGSAAPAGPTRDAILALVALGYKQQDASAMLEKVRKHSTGTVDNVEDLVRLALSTK
ncbi:Holliday junction branch migration protein RuvA [Kiritimatiellaeota bacterium B1221]|nr:Holliday junction branch migration protein RuvA [Kiritimatiellaeota bacterium B1221]